VNSLQDALYNWLTIKVVSEDRPDDLSADETKKLFEAILTEDHGLANIKVTKDEDMYYVHFEKDGEKKHSRFPVELIEVMLLQMRAEPEKFKNYPK
jgi:hypothetical protein